MSYAYDVDGLPGLRSSARLLLSVYTYLYRIVNYRYKIKI